MKKLTTASFINKSIKKHGDLFDYTASIYTGAHKHVQIGCNRCGELFKVRADSHLAGCGHKGCSNCKSQEQFITNIEMIHGSNIDVSSVVYKKAKQKIDVICAICSKQFPTTAHRLLEGHGCPFCLGFYKTTQEFVEEAGRIYNYKYDYIFTNYINSSIKILILCKDCGNLFTKTPSNHLQGQGCSICREGSSYGFDFSKPAIMYYLKDNITGLYKIGITNRTPKERFGKLFNELTLLKTWSFSKGLDARNKEQSLLEEFQGYRVINNRFKNNGGTEFFNRDILGLEVGGFGILEQNLNTEDQKIELEETT